MPTKEENELLTRVGPGTPMGDVVRRFWLPAISSSEVPEPDCPPIRVRLLGEDLVAFRDSTGKVGLVEAHCAHRGASLFFGRNEECGIRCVYHGWKFDVEGNCVDMPSEPAESNFRDKIHLTAYPTHEHGGVVWAYLGPKAQTPELPQLEWLLAPDTRVVWSKHLVEANFVQVLEGTIDSVHTCFLHTDLEEYRTPPDAYKSLNGDLTSLPAMRILQVSDKTPRFFVKDTDYGAIIAARRNAGEEHYYWRIAQYLMPVFYMVGHPQNFQLGVGATVPLDDVNTMHWTLRLVRDRPSAEKDRAYRERPQPHAQLDERTWQYNMNRHNDYLIDRDEQRTTSFTGIGDHGVQDLAMTECMGPIFDRSQEHLGSTDLGIIAMRRRLLQAAQDLQQGIEPYPAQHPEVYRIRPAAVVLPRDVAYDEDAGVRDLMLAKA